MRLFAKSEVLQAKNTERAKEIAEGLKISGRVDQLRELQAKEEATLEKWRTETISSIHEEIKAISETKEALVAEVSSLRAEKDKGLAEIAERSAALDDISRVQQEREAVLADQLIRLENREGEINEHLQSARNTLERARTREEISENLHRKMLRELEDAEKERAVARKIRSDAEILKQERENLLSEREAAVEAREKTLASMTEAVNERARELEVKELRLIDREQTLERELQRRGKR